MVKMKDDKTTGLMTERMDRESQEFKDFQLLIRAKAENLPPAIKNKVQLFTLRLKMQDYLKSNQSKIITVGYFLKQALKRLKIKQNRFASYIDLKAPNLSKILKDQRKINMEQALIFESIFDIEAEVWLRIQTKQELAELEKMKVDKFDKYSLEELVYEG